MGSECKLFMVRPSSSSNNHSGQSMVVFVCVSESECWAVGTITLFNSILTFVETLFIAGVTASRITPQNVIGCQWKLTIVVTIDLITWQSFVWKCTRCMLMTSDLSTPAPWTVIINFEWCEVNVRASLWLTHSRNSSMAILWHFDGIIIACVAT